MSNCPKCGAQINAGAKFCTSCGAPVAQAPAQEAPVVAPVQEPVAPIQEPVAPIQEPVAPPQEKPAEVPAWEQPEVTPEKPKKKIPLLPIILGAVGVLLVVVIVVLLLTGVISFGGKKKGQSYALYLKDNQLFYNSLKKDSKSWQVTSDLFDSDDVSNNTAASLGSQLGYYTYLTEDSKYIFYVDKIDMDGDNGPSLYYREVNNEKKDPVKIDANVGQFYVNKNSTLVTYLKGEDGDLYQYNIKKDSKDKIASEVTEFVVSEDGKTVYFGNEEGSIYMKLAGKDKEKLASEIDSLEYISLEKKTFYYTKEDALYKQVVGKDKEKILSDIKDVLAIYDSGEIYYTTGESKEVPLINYVTDDMKEADAAMQEPRYPEYPNYPSRPSQPYSWMYDSVAEYESALAVYQQELENYNAEYDRIRNEYDQAVEAYRTASDEYYKKQNRDSMRADLAEQKIMEHSYSLYYFDGKKETLVSDAIYYYGYADRSSIYTNDYAASDAAVIRYEATKPSELKTIKLSEIDSIYSVENMVSEAMDAAVEMHIAVKATDTALQAEKEIHCFTMSDDGSDIYYIDNVADEKNYGTLYHMTINKGTLGKAEVYDNDVYYGYLSIQEDGKVTYFKEVTTVEAEGDSYGFDKGELYLNKTRVDYDVRTASVLYDEDNGMLYYTDYNQEKKCGTLKIFKGNKATKIADDVYSRIMLPNGHVLYLSDYSLKNYKGQLNDWSNGKNKKLDDDVAALLPIVSFRDLY